MKRTYSFSFNGTTITEQASGRGSDDGSQPCSYLQDLWALAEAYAGAEGSNILEWGSGISTLMFADFLMGKKGSLTTLDDNILYQRAVIAAVENKGQVNPYSQDLIGATGRQLDRGLNYSTLPLCFASRFDLVYIGGRRRLECALVASMVADAGTTVLVHDYRRSRYQAMLGLYDVIEDGPHFRVMKVKAEILRVFSACREHIVALSLR